MKDVKPIVSQERLHSLLDYNPKSGRFRWKVKRGPRFAGNLAGGKASSGKHSHVTIDGRYYNTHDLVWLYAKGEWPENGIKHKDANRFNNRLANLYPRPKGTN